jgi:hypothetical protein
MDVVDGEVWKPLRRWVTVQVDDDRASGVDGDQESSPVRSARLDPVCRDCCRADDCT